MTRKYFLSSAVALFAGGLSSAKAAGAAQPLTKKELKDAITKASTAQDHRRIAAYYQKEADRMMAEATEHDDLAAAYAKSPTAHASKHPMSGQTAEHCRYFADAARKAGQAAKELANLHEQMAKETR